MSDAAEAGLRPLPYEAWSDTARSILPRYLRRPELYLSGGAPMPQALGLLANHVPLGIAWMGFTEMLVGDASTLDPRLRELAILRVSWQAASDYEWMQHARIGLHTGLTIEQIRAVPDGPEAKVWTPLEKNVLDAVDQVMTTARIDAPTWQGLTQHLDAAQLLELTFVIGGYLCFAVVTNSVGMVADPPTEPIDVPHVPARTDDP